MAIEIKHQIDASGISSQIAQGVKEGVSQGFANALNRLMSANLGKDSPINQAAASPAPSSKASTQQDNDANTLTQKFSTLSDKVQSLTMSLEKMILAQDEAARKMKSSDRLAGVAQMPAKERKQVLQELEEHEKKLAAQRKQEAIELTEFYDERRSSNRVRNVGMGILSGAALAAVYQAGNWGQVMGSQTQSINAGALNYSKFTNQYYGQTLDMQRNIGMGAAMAAGGAAGALFSIPGIGIPLGIAGMGVAGLANYFMGKNTEQEKAYNEFALNQDLAAYRMEAYGISGKGTQTMSATGGIFGDKVNIPLTQLQSYMKTTPGYGAYMPYVEDVTMGARLDVISKMSPEQQADYVINSALLGQVTRISPGEISASVSNISGMTGKNANETLNRMLSYQLQYGGDMKSNMNKIIQLMQTGGYSQDQAANLAYRYQYNEPMLQQKVEQSWVNPTNRFIGDAYGKIISAQTGLQPDQFVDEYRKIVKGGSKSPQDIIRTQLMEQYFKAMSINPRISDIGENKGVPNRLAGGGMENIPETEAQKSMNKMIEDALNNLNTVNMKATTVYLTGMTENAPMMSVNKSSYTATAVSNKYTTEADLKRAIVEPFDESKATPVAELMRQGKSQMEQLGKRLGKTLNVQKQNRSGTGTSGVNN